VRDLSAGQIFDSNEDVLFRRCAADGQHGRDGICGLRGFWRLHLRKHCSIGACIVSCIVSCIERWA
jgi:hypothetical protein